MYFTNKSQITATILFFNDFLYYLFSVRHLNILNTVRETKQKVETELFRGGLKYLNRTNHHQLVMFKGSGYGCSFSAKMLFERVVSACENKAKPYYLKDPSEMVHIPSTEKAVIYVSDVNGPTGGDIGRLNGWYEWLKEYMPVGTSVKRRLTIIMNLQDCDLPEDKNHPIYQRYSEYIVDAAKKEFRPTSPTKTQLLMAFIKQKNVEVSKIKGEPAHLRKSEEATLIDKKIVDGIIPLLGSVRCVGKLAELFRSDFAESLNILTKPIPEIVQRIRKSYEEGGSLFLTLLAVLAHGGQLGVGEVNQMRKLNEHCEKFWYSADNIDQRPKGGSRKMEKWFNSKSLFHLYKFAQDNNHLIDLGNNLQKYARCLDGEFLSESNHVYRFCDGRVHYSFLLVYCEKFPDALEFCEDRFFFNFVHSERTIQGNEEHVMLKINDRKLDVRTRAVMKRFEIEMVARHVGKCMKHPLMSTAFFQLFLKFLGETKHLLWKILTQQDCDPTEPYSCLYHGMEKEQDTFKGIPRNITEVIILHDIWRKKRNKKKWKQWIHTQEFEALLHAVEMSNFQTFQLMVEKGVHIEMSALLKAIDVNAEKIIEFIHSERKFNTQENFEISQYAAEKVSGEVEPGSLVQVLLQLILTVNVNTSYGEIPPLVHYAVQTNNRAMLQKLFDGSMGTSNVNKDAVSKGERPLTVATRLGLQDITSILLDNNAKPNKSDVFIAVNEGHTEILKLFITQHPPLLHTTNSQGQTLLHIYAEMGNSQMIRELIDFGLPVNAKDINNETPLSLACNGKHVHSIRIILQAWNQSGFHKDEMVVMRAVQNGDIELLELLMQYGFDVDFVNREFGVPLHVAIQYNLRDMLRFLLSNGANPDIVQDGHRAIHIAAAKDDFESLLLLKDYGADILALTDTKDSIVHIAADKKHAHFIEAVFKMPDISPLLNAKNGNWETALHIACKHGSVVLTKLLLKIGFNPKLPNKAGCIPEVLVDKQFKKMKDSKVVQKWAPFAECLNTLQNWH